MSFPFLHSVRLGHLVCVIFFLCTIIRMYTYIFIYIACVGAERGHTFACVSFISVNLRCTTCKFISVNTCYVLFIYYCCFFFLFCIPRLKEER